MSAVGWIGLGTMGRPMAGHLQSGGHRLFVHTRSGVPEAFANSATALNLALSNARRLGIALPNTATAQELFNTCVAHGGESWDHSAMLRALEIMANAEITRAQ